MSSYLKIPYENVKPGDEIYIKRVNIGQVSSGDKCYVDFSGGDLGSDENYPKEVELVTIYEIGENRWPSGDPDWHTDISFVERPNKRYFGKYIRMYLLKKFKQ